METFFEAPSVPTNSCILLATPAEARAWPRGDLQLAVCRACGFIANVAFDAALTEYSGRYEETQGFSGTFNEFQGRLARDLVDTYDLRESDVLEIGCGKGEFLTLLAEFGANRCLGFDPGFDAARAPSPARGSVRVETTFFTEAHAHLTADLVVCKMTLEHVAEPRPLVAAMARVAAHRPGTLVFIQVPDVTRILRDCAFEDVYYEHCAYYGPDALARLFHRAGFGVRRLESVYDGQYLTLVASLRTHAESDGFGGDDDRARHLATLADFRQRCRERLADWQVRLDAWRAAGRRVVLWGSGSKAVSFLATLDAPVVERVVDINPHRQGHYMPGTGQPIIAPDDLVERAPDVVVVMNRVYLDEIGGALRERGLAPEIVAL